MEKIQILVLGLLLSGGLSAQPFLSHPFHVAVKGDSLNIQWGDLNGDGLLDIVVFSQTANNLEAYALIQEDSTIFLKSDLELDLPSKLNFQLKDFNHDGNLDIIYLNNTDELNVALNLGNLTFDLMEVDFLMSEFLILDFDHDGDEDIIASINVEGNNGSIYWIKNDSAFIKMNEIQNLSLTGKEYFIKNESIRTVLKNDLVGYELMELNLNRDSLILSSIIELPEIQSMSQGDLSHHGNVDLVYQSNDHIIVKYANGESFPMDTLSAEARDQVELFVGDFDLDGLADILTTSEGGFTVYYKGNESKDFAPDSAFFEINNSFMNMPADINDDGDLDLLSLVLENDSIQFYVQLNQTTILNKGPKPVYISPPLTVYDQTFLSWQRTGDDHTDTLAISYELFIQSEDPTIYHTMPGYDMDTTRRKGFRNVVGHGYQWFDNSYTARSLENGRYQWGVVGVDNAYFASSDIRKCVGGGPCIDFYTNLNCFDLIVEDTVVCYNTEITIDLDRVNDSISWFSVKQGFLEKSLVLTFKALESDTIYAIHYPMIPCGEESDLCVLNYSMAIEVEEREEQLLDEVTICSGMENVIEVQGEWDNVRWWFDDKVIATGQEITLDSVPTNPIVAEAFDSLQCSVYDTLVLKEAELTIDREALPDTIIACQGQATEITVFNEMDVQDLQFAWSPAQHFVDATVVNPTIIVSQISTISVVISSGMCILDTISFRVQIVDTPVVTTSSDQEIYRGEKAFIESEGALSYTWFPEAGLQSPNAQNTWAEPNATTTYTVRGVGDSGCYGESNTTVIVQSSVFVPDLFSPNGDGRNDYLRVYGEGIKQLSLRVFDERGSLLAEIDESSNAQGWDGTVSGNELPSGTYFWTVSGEFADGQAISYQGKNKGTIRLVR